jgi:hypothetical protein
VPGPRGSYKKWLLENAVEAAQIVKDGEMTMSEAAHLYTIPRTTLGNRVEALRNGVEIGKAGAKTVFPREVEGALAEYTRDAFTVRRPNVKSEIMKRAYAAAEEYKLAFDTDDRLPGDKWFRSFCRRWDIVARPVQQQHGKPPSRVAVDAFFDTYQRAINTHHYTRSRIWNADEVRSVVHAVFLSCPPPGLLRNARRSCIACAAAIGIDWLPTL